MARTRRPSDLATPASCTGRADQTGYAGGATRPGPGRQIVSQDSTKRRQPIRRSGRDPGRRPYAPSSSKPGRQGRKHDIDPPCRIWRRYLRGSPARTVVVMWLRLSMGPTLRLTNEAAILALAGGRTCATVPVRAPAMSTSTTPPLTRKPRHAQGHLAAQLGSKGWRTGGHVNGIGIREEESPRTQCRRRWLDAGGWLAGGGAEQVGPMPQVGRARRRH